MNEQQKMEILAGAVCKDIQQIEFLTSLIARLESPRMTDEAFKAALDDVSESRAAEFKKKQEDIPDDIKGFVDNLLEKMSKS